MHGYNGYGNYNPSQGHNGTKAESFLAKIASHIDTPEKRRDVAGTFQRNLERHYQNTQVEREISNVHDRLQTYMYDTRINELRDDIDRQKMTMVCDDKISRLMRECQVDGRERDMMAHEVMQVSVIDRRYCTDISTRYNFSMPCTKLKIGERYNFDGKIFYMSDERMMVDTNTGKKYVIDEITEYSHTNAMYISLVELITCHEPPKTNGEPPEKLKDGEEYRVLEAVEEIEENHNDNGKHGIMDKIFSFFRR